jgi:uncharacterized protein (TIGR00299 family) protein
VSLVLYLDLFSGASGDMLLGALVDAGLSLDRLRCELGKMTLPGYELEAEAQVRHGILGTKLMVRELTGERPARRLPDIRALVEGSTLSSCVKQSSLAVFERLARAEARIHGSSADLIHFHELSGVDSLVDIVGFAVGLELLGVSAVYASSVPLGTGSIEMSHGVVPVPAPATLALLAEAGAPTRPHPAETEIVTPTAAAILVQFAEFERPPMRVCAVGYGLGSKEFPWVNALRAWLGEAPDLTTSGRDYVALMECNLDDTTGEALGYAMMRLLDAGALDVWFTPVQMKKNRPGIMLSVLVPPDGAQALAEVVLRETSTLGVRLSPPLQRIVADRQLRAVETPWGKVRVKEKWLADEQFSVSPEYEDCARIARQHSIPLAQVFATVMQHAAASQPT